MAPTLSLKLLINKNTGEVLFGEAKKDFIDFLFSLLAFPIGYVAKLLTEKRTVGCTGSLYESLENLTVDYIQPNFDRNALLDPRMFIPINGPNPPLLLRDVASTTSKYYSCSNPYNYINHLCYVTDVKGGVCPSCLNVMVNEVVYVRHMGVESGSDGGGGCVKGVATYIVKDNLAVRPMSTVSSIAILNELNVKDLSAIREKVVEVGMDEGLALLKASLESKTVLTDVFGEKLKKGLDLQKELLTTKTIEIELSERRDEEEGAAGGEDEETGARRDEEEGAAGGEDEETGARRDEEEGAAGGEDEETGARRDEEEGAAGGEDEETGARRDEEEGATGGEDKETGARRDEEEGAARGEDEETGAQIAPIVRLEEVTVTTGEEEEDILLKLKAKLYRFDNERNQWKEHGVGSVKLLKHKENGKVRLVMRQAKTFKIYANHPILPSISIQEAGNDKSCVWHAFDFSYGELKEELFCIHFKSTKNCRNFMKMVEEIAQSQEKKEENKELATSAAGLLEKLSVGESKTEEKAGEEK